MSTIFNANSIALCAILLHFVVEDFAILLANRSAALYHLEKYDHALNDVLLAEMNYPRDMLYKIKERSARCYLAKKDYERALDAFK